MPCKCEQPETWKGPTSGVFSDFLDLDYYDGYITAVAKCIGCRTPKLFNVISWQPSRSLIRIFGVATITSASFDRIKRDLLVRQHAVDEGRTKFDDAYDASLSDLLQNSPSPQVVFASTHPEKEILAARSVAGIVLGFADPIEHVSEERFLEWLTFLDLGNFK